MDEYNYDRLAFALAGGEGDRSLLPFSLPLYPRFLALLDALFGRDLLLVRLIQSAIGAGSVVLLYFLGRKIAGEKTGLLAGVLLAVYGMAVFHEGLLVPATLALFLSLSALLFWANDRRGFFRGTAGGILLGLAGLAAAADLLFAFLVVLLLFTRGRGGMRTAAGALLGIALALAPFTRAGYFASGDLILASAHGGVNFYIGNNPEANGGYRTPVLLTPSASGIMRDSIRIAETETGQRLSPAETSRFWFRKGWAFIRSSPAAFVKRAFAKLRLLISRWEYCDVGGVRIGRQETFRFLGAPLLPFILIGPLGLAGMILGISRWRDGRQSRNPLILYIYATAHVAGITFFYYQARARLLLIPVLCFFAADTLLALLGAWREKRFRRAVMILALTAWCGLLSASPPWREMRSETNVLIMAAQDEAGEGRHAAAREKIALARTLNPELGGADLVEGGIYFLAGDRVRAENLFRTAARREPLNPDPALNLGFLLLEQKRDREAQEEALRALAADPLSAKAYVLLARIVGRGNDAEREGEAYRRALELNPNDIEALLNLAGISAQRGDLRETERLRKRAERIEPKIRRKAEDRR
jgi:Tfp pilus assembly protein PilF